MGHRDIHARFYGGCTIIVDSRIAMSNVEFEVAKKYLDGVGGFGTILQEFIDEDGWQGYYIYPVDLSEDE